MKFGVQLMMPLNGEMLPRYTPSVIDCIPQITIIHIDQVYFRVKLKLNLVELQTKFSGNQVLNFKNIL